MSYSKANSSSMTFHRTEIRVVTNVLRRSMKKNKTDSAERSVLYPVLKQLDRAMEKMDIAKIREQEAENE